MKCRLFFLSFILLLTCPGYTKIPLSLEESVVLKHFFQNLFEESEAGYVFFGKKPVCINAFFYKDPFLVRSPLHKQSVALREGSRIWNKINEGKSDVFVHICKKEDPDIPGCLHILVINRSLFYSVVEKNLALFQYVLGPFVTPQSLFNKLLEDDQTYYSLLKKDKVLIGNILGFGMHNALHGSRIENIQEAIDEEALPPFVNAQLVLHNSNQNYLPCQPGFGFKSPNEELKKLEDKTTISSEKLIQNKPEFIFGWLKDSGDTRRYISELENAQDKIQALLKSPNFLSKVLEKFTGQQFQIATGEDFRFQFEKEKLHKLVAKGLWESIQKYDNEFLSYFIEGMEGSDSLVKNIPRLAYFPNYRREILEAKNNLEQASELFRSFEHEQGIICIVPQKLYYKILKTGHIEKECTTPLVSLEFSVFNPLGHCLNYQANQTIDLRNTISGFAHGVKGMKVGETREIFIHPSLGYGFETSLDKCISLRAVVTLLKIHDAHDVFLPVEHLDLSFFLNEDFLIERTENYKAALIEKGKEISEHLQKNPQLDLHEVCSHLKNFQDNSEKFAPTTDEEQAVINQVHWNIYFGPNSF